MLGKFKNHNFVGMKGKGLGVKYATSDKQDRAILMKSLKKDPPSSSKAKALSKMKK